MSPEDEETGATDSLEAAFAKIIEAKKAAGSKKRAGEAVKLLSEALGSLDDGDFRQIVASEEIQELLHRTTANTASKPGDPVLDDRGREIYRVAYSYDWVVTHMPMVRWTVPPNPFGRRVWEPPSWNGVSCPVVLRNATEVETPSCFRDIVMEAYQQVTRALEGQVNVIAGVGARAADGVGVESGFMKQTEEEMIASGQWVRR